MVVEFLFYDSSIILIMFAINCIKIKYFTLNEDTWISLRYDSLILFIDADNDYND